jgi:hypothetical protein
MQQPKRRSKLPEEDIEAHINPGMSDVAIVVRGHSAHINAHFSFGNSLEPFFLPGHGVIEMEITISKSNPGRGYDGVS